MVLFLKTGPYPDGQAAEHQEELQQRQVQMLCMLCMLGARNLQS